jgi:hypothetical protein
MKLRCGVQDNRFVFPKSLKADVLTRSYLRLVRMVLPPDSARA